MRRAAPAVAALAASALWAPAAIGPALGQPPPPLPEVCEAGTTHAAGQVVAGHVAEVVGADARGFTIGRVSACRLELVSAGGFAARQERPLFGRRSFSVVATPAGALVIVWERRVANVEGAEFWEVWALVRSAEGQWGAPVDLSRLDGRKESQERNPDVAVDAAGRVSVAWGTSTIDAAGPVHAIAGATWSAGGGWQATAPIGLPPVPADATAPQLVAMDDGSVVVVWFQIDDDLSLDPATRLSLRAALLSAGGRAWTTPVRVDSTGDVLSESVALVEAGGAAHVLWLTGFNRPAGQRILARALSPAGTLGEERAVAAIPGGTSGFAAAAAGERIVVAWGEDRVARAAVSEPGGAGPWSTSVLVRDAFGPEFVVGATGGAALAGGFTLDSPRPRVLLARLAPATGAWTVQSLPVPTASGPLAGGLGPDFVRAALYPDGRPVVSFLRAKGGPPAGGSFLFVAGPGVGRTRPAEGAGITLSASQLQINQRIAQAAIRRLNELEAVLEARPGPAAPRADAGEVRLSVTQLLINQRIAQAAVRRANALAERLDGREPEPPSPPRGDASDLTLSVGQLLINQRIAQAAVRRANALAERVAAGARLPSTPG